jgi:hypothetical protein
VGRGARRDHERWTFATLRDTSAPWFNVGASLPSALSPDLTMLVPPERLIDPADAGCASVDRLMAPLRLAGVAHVISLDALDHPDLVARAAERPPALAPLTVFAYALADPLPMAGIEGGSVTIRRHEPGAIDLEVTATAPGTLVVREAFADGWKATVDGIAARIDLYASRHMSVLVPGGTHLVRLEYVPPGFRAGVLIAIAAALVTLGLAFIPIRPASSG